MENAFWRSLMVGVENVLDFFSGMSDRDNSYSAINNAK